MPRLWDTEKQHSYCALLGTEIRARTLKNEVPVDKYFVDCLCVSLHPEGFDPGLDKICMTFSFQVSWCLGSSADLIYWQLLTLQADAHQLLGAGLADQPAE